MKEQECPICGEALYEEICINCPICGTMIHTSCLITCSGQSCEMMGCELCFIRGQSYLNLDELYCGEICEEQDRIIIKTDREL